MVIALKFMYIPDILQNTVVIGFYSVYDGVIILAVL
jgi:hypothetical protein